MRKLATVLASLVLLAPTLTSASTYFCPNLVDDLKQGTCDTSVSDDLTDLCVRHVSGTQVVDLQHFLTDYYHPATNIMLGYFGNKTKKLVQQFQGEQNLPQSGQVRAMTRAAIARVCGGAATGETLPPDGTNLQGPTCTLNVNPSSISVGQSSTLTWTSTNSSGGTIIPIGIVAANGSQTTAPLQTTTFSGTFWNAGGDWQVAHCSATLTVTPQTTDHASCTFNNQIIPDGQSVTAYRAPTVPVGNQCVSQTRICHNGTLDGMYQYATCTPSTSTTSCTPEAPQTQTLSCLDGLAGTIIQTRVSSCPGPTWGPWTTTSNTCGTTGNVNGGGTIQQQTCAQIEACINTLGQSNCPSLPPECSTGSNTTATCTPEAPLTQTLACPTGQTGAITQTRTSTCPGPTWGPWTTTSNTCVTATTANTGTPSIAVTSTNPSGSVAIGSPITIYFATNNAPAGAVVSPMFVNSSGTIVLQGLNKPAVNGLYQLTVQYPGLTPGNYSIRLRLNDANANQTIATSPDFPITVTVTGTTANTGAPSITITQPVNLPSGGWPTFAAGSLLTVSWVSQNAPAGAYARLSGPNFPLNDFNHLPVSGSYTVTVPTTINMTSNTYAVGLTLYDSNDQFLTSKIQYIKVVCCNEIIFTIGDRVHVVHPGGVTVYSQANTSSAIGTQAEGAQGTVVEGPIPYGGGYNWWRVDFDTSPDGWVLVPSTNANASIAKISGTTGLAPNQTQLAATLVALQGVLQEILKLLGQ